MGAELFIIDCNSLGYCWEEWLVSVVDLLLVGRCAQIHQGYCIVDGRGFSDSAIRILAMLESALMKHLVASCFWKVLLIVLH